MFCISVCPTDWWLKWWLQNINIQIFSDQLLYTEHCSRCSRENKDGKKSSSLPQARSQGEVGPGKPKASLLRMLRHELAKSQVPNWNVVVTVLLVKFGRTVWLVIESFPRVRTNKQACWRSYSWVLANPTSQVFQQIPWCAKISWALLLYK